VTAWALEHPWMTFVLLMTLIFMVGISVETASKNWARGAAPAALRRPPQLPTPSDHPAAFGRDRMARAWLHGGVVRIFGRPHPQSTNGSSTIEPTLGSPEVELRFTILPQPEPYLVETPPLYTTLVAIAEGLMRRAILGRCKVPRKLKKAMKKRGEWS
jgi:hypothetical protein